MPRDIVGELKAELAPLEEKTTKLAAFLNKEDTWLIVGADMHTLLYIQLEHMEGYAAALRQRIEALETSKA